MDQSRDYKELFEKECERAKALEREIEIMRAERSAYSRELSVERRIGKMKKKELADAWAQTIEVANDLHTKNKETRAAYSDTIHRLVRASEYKDQDTGKHIARISHFSVFLAEKMGLNKGEKEDLLLAAPMHDVGKIGIPDNIILKNSRLTEGEFSIIKTHTTIGAGILEDSEAKVLKLGRVIALSHHEKWNGSGYPSGLAGEKIPLYARIVAITDAFDALTSKRPYKNPYPVNVACDIIRKERGNHFDPAITDIFLENIDEIVRIKCGIDGLEEIQEIPDFAWSERDLKVMSQK